MQLQDYMSKAIRRIMAKAYAGALGNPREAKFAHRMQRLFRQSEQHRQAIKNKEGIDVPPFLICSIATTCNLHCKGCYARANGIAHDGDTSGNPPLTPSQWKTIFLEAAAVGVNFALLAGGEPLMRRDILEQAAEVEDMVFPVFTNGTLIGPSYIEFFRTHLNLVPVISIEGGDAGTDERRGKGVFLRAMRSMSLLHEEKLFFGVSITVTTENLQQVSSPDFIKTLHEKGCKLLFYVEYVPTDPATEHLALNEEQNRQLEQLLEQRLGEFTNMIILSFPGDEKALGGCLASGRGFFHIAPDGSAEPCPFSPHSDSNVAEIGLKAALQSPLFRKLREANALQWTHTGGCTLWEHREEVEKMANS